MKKLLFGIIALALLQIFIYYDNKPQEPGDPRDSLSEEEYHLYYDDPFTTTSHDSIYNSNNIETERNNTDGKNNDRKKQRKKSAYEIGFEAGYNDGLEDGTMELGNGYSYNDNNPYADVEEYKRGYRAGYKKGHNEGFYEYEYGDEDDYDEY